MVFYVIAATGASTNPCSETYCGTAPESEIESKNLADFIRKNKSIIKAYITIHSYSQMLLFPYSYTYELAADHDELVSHCYVPQHCSECTTPTSESGYV